MVPKPAARRRGAHQRHGHDHHRDVPAAHRQPGVDRVALDDQRRDRREEEGDRMAAGDRVAAPVHDRQRLEPPRHHGGLVERRVLMTREEARDVGRLAHDGRRRVLPVPLAGAHPADADLGQRVDQTRDLDPVVPRAQAHLAGAAVDDVLAAASVEQRGLPGVEGELEPGVTTAEREALGGQLEGLLDQRGREADEARRVVDAGARVAEDAPARVGVDAHPHRREDAQRAFVQLGAVVGRQDLQGGGHGIPRRMTAWARRESTARTRVVRSGPVRVAGHRRVSPYADQKEGASPG